MSHYLQMERGTLYIIATPIGNLEDITYRAINTLNNIDVAFCEDTRHTGRLLSHYNIKIPLKSLHAHSSEYKIKEALKFLSQGKSIAYLTDAGTPGISDPGSKLIEEARKENHQISPIPGASALSTLISVSGFSGKEIIFGGFLSKKPGKRINELNRLKEFNGIIVIYESPHRIKKMLNAIKEVFPEGDIVIGREMTKLYEEFISGAISSLDIENIKEKGEFAIAIKNNV